MNTAVNTTVNTAAANAASPGTAPPAAVDRTDEADHLLGLLAAMPAGPGRDRCRESLIAGLLPLARRMALRYRGRGESDDDLFQVACVGLVKSIDRFDPARGHPFLSFAVPTITGEIKCHFRDHAWTVRVPRRIQEVQPQVRLAQSLLEQLTPGVRPSVPALAASTGLPEEDVREALAAEGAFRTRSLDMAVNDGSDLPLADSLGFEEPALALVIDCMAVRTAARRLTERERDVLYQRFYHYMTQRQIADGLGVSQMHVSRILTASLARLRRELLDPGPDART
ncbi:SigB/SigF/SigG family RNA polymerase sigma factor [Actinacidiphila alni]|uniref:SigB/SigF/SigG family RNA polymerase sigma factor n=1 Tax=Actinacidiphila alni TaxID=380248 RepID=UPI0033FC6CA7